MKHLLRFSLLLTAVIWTSTTQAQSAWPLAQGTWSLTPVVTVERFDTFYKGQNRTKTTDHVYQYSELIFLEYGVSQSLTMDFSTGYSHSPHTNWSDARTTKSGRTDTTLGVRYRILDEFTAIKDSTPTVSIRLAGILEGNYATGAANSVGDGANGVELGLLFGKNVPEWNGGYYGSFAYQIRNQDVPDGWLGTLGVFKNVGERWRINAGSRIEWATSGLDIASAEWAGYSAPKPFHQTKERRVALETGVSYTDGGNRTWSLNYGRVIDGRNTSLDDALTFSVTFGF